MSVTTPPPLDGADGATGPPPPDKPDDPRELLAVESVARLLTCSTRYVYRMKDAGDLPAPRRLGRLCRWSKRELVDWIAAGCPSPRKTGWRWKGAKP